MLVDEVESCGKMRKELMRREVAARAASDPKLHLLCMLPRSDDCIHHHAANAGRAVSVHITSVNTAPIWLAWNLHKRDACECILNYLNTEMCTREKHAY